MDKITIKKLDLLEQLSKNRELHRAQYEAAFVAYRQRLMKLLEDNLDRLERKEGEVMVVIDLVRPQDHTEDYDRAIEMLKWELNNEIQLSLQEFTQLVQDDWGWKQQFTASNKFYGVSS